jgi:hypothetical protein
MKNNTFFSCTKNSYEAINRLFNFLWPAAVGLWNLKWQLIGYKTVNPNSTVNEVNEKFANGFGLANFDFTDLTNNDNSFIINGISETLLLNFFAIYEGWIDDIVKCSYKIDKVISKQLQFPSDVARTKGVYAAIDKVQSKKSTIIQHYYYPKLKAHKKYHLKSINNILYCYRVFKEMRNCIVHNNRKVSQELIDSYNEYTRNVTSPQDLSVKVLPVIHIGALNDEITLDIKGLVCFSEIIMILMTTLDIELCLSAQSETYIMKKYKPHGNKLTISSNDPIKRIKTINAIIKSEHYIPVEVDETLIQHFISEGVIH